MNKKEISNFLGICIENSECFFKFLKLAQHIIWKISRGERINEDFFRWEWYVDIIIDIFRRLEILNTSISQEILSLPFEKSILKVIELLILEWYFDEDEEFLQDVSGIYTKLAQKIWPYNIEKVQNYVQEQVEKHIENYPFKTDNIGLDTDQIYSFTEELITYIQKWTLSSNIDYMTEIIDFFIEIDEEEWEEISSILIGDFWVNIYKLQERIWLEEYEFVAHEILFYVLLSYVEDNYTLMEKIYSVLLEYYHIYDDNEKIQELRSIRQYYTYLQSTE